MHPIMTRLSSDCHAALMSPATRVYLWTRPDQLPYRCDPGKQAAVAFALYGLRLQARASRPARWRQNQVNLGSNSRSAEGVDLFSSVSSRIQGAGPGRFALRRDGEGPSPPFSY